MGGAENTRNCTIAIASNRDGVVKPFLCTELLRKNSGYVRRVTLN